jgi:dissimilatory sulfite reductase (desulfoviridin) alpha/beta subunit
MIRAWRSRGIMQERDKDRFTIRLALVGGYLDAELMRRVAELVAQYGAGHVHLTTRQGVEIPHVPCSCVEELATRLEKAGAVLGYSGPRVRGITACPGSSTCRFGQIDAQNLARQLSEYVGDRDNLPAKFKIAVAGCPNGCTKPAENDFGVLGLANGYRIFIGGRMGRKPRPGTPLPEAAWSTSDVLRTAASVLNWFAANGRPKERLGAMVDRIGLQDLLRHSES